MLSACARQPLPIDELPQCASPVATSTPGGWRRVAERHNFAFFLPPSCVEEQDAPRFVHGGQRWRCGTMTVDVVWGMWGLRSFGQRESQCKRTDGNVPVLESTQHTGDQYRQVVWYLTGHGHEPAVSAWSAVPTDVPLIRAVTASGVFLGLRGRGHDGR